MAPNPSLRPSVVLAAYAESLVDGGRVIVFGDASSPLPERLVERGARLVHVYDRDPARVAEAATRNTSRSIAYAPLGDGGLAVREGSFDVALVENLAEMADPAGLMRRVDRVLSGRGIALVACANAETNDRLLPEGKVDDQLDYYGLYDLVAAQFEHVRMLGQTPFVGYAVVDFLESEDPAPSFDTGFLPGGAEEAEWFIALGSQREVALDEFAIIQLPLAETLECQSTTELKDELAQARAAERQARDRMAQLEAAQLEAGRQRRERSTETEELKRLKKQLKKRDQWLEQLEERSTTADARADEAQNELDALQRRFESGEREAAKLRRQLDEERERGRGAARDAELSEQLEARIAELQSEVRFLSERANDLEKEAAGDVERLEMQLAERGEEVHRLEAALREAGRTGRELWLKLEDLRATESEEAESIATATAKPSESVEHPAPADTRQARREANLAAAEWTIARLLAQLEETAGSDMAEAMRELHEARVKLQHQSVLLEQRLAVEPSHPSDASGQPTGAGAEEPDH